MKKTGSFVPVICVLIVGLLFLAGCSSVPRRGSAERLPPGWQERSMVHDGLTRWYRIYSPDPLPEKPSLVLYLHGGTLSMRSLFSPWADSSAAWFEIAEEEGLVLVVPNGVNPDTGDTYGNDQTWNDLRPDHAEGQTQVDDVGFILSLLDAISVELPIDFDQVYVTGASNGGMMSYRLLIEAPTRFAAGAVYIANLPDLAETIPEPSQNVPILIMNGTEDPLMPFEGGPVARGRGQVISTRETAAWWVQMNGANSELMTSRTLPDLDQDDLCLIREEIYPATAAGAEVRLYIMEGGGHTLPSITGPNFITRWLSPFLGPVCQDIDGVRLAWDFFKDVSGQSHSE